MKKIILLSFALLALTSCKKWYNCNCVQTEALGPNAQPGKSYSTLQVEAYTKKQAEQDCSQKLKPYAECHLQ